MTSWRVLVATWTDGLFVLDGKSRTHELPGQSLRALVPDGKGGYLAIVDGRSLRRRAPDGAWTPIAASDVDLSCCVAAGEGVYLGTDDARILRLDSDGTLAPLPGFDAVAGRDTWYAGSMIVDGRRMGPPLGIRSMTVTAGGVLLANVHVGGIPRSTDGGVTWHPTIAVDADVHEVRAHPTRPDVVVAAAGAGLCTSHDGGSTWRIEQGGLHAPHCSSVAFVGDDVLVGASTDPFAAEGAVYRRPVDERGPVRAAAGLPRWLDGGADTGCIASNGGMVALADKRGSVYVSEDAGSKWARRATDLPGPSCVLVR